MSTGEPLEKQQSILLETGTNEVEIAELIVNNQSFGLNVAKVQQIVQISRSDITHLPTSHPSLLGTIIFRGRTIPLIDLKHVLFRKFMDPEEVPLVLVTEFNETMIAFLVNGAEQIHRFTWDDLQPLSAFLRNNTSHVTGTLTVKGKDILILDIEHLTAQILPEVSFKEIESDESGEDVREKRQAVRVLYAEDSSFIRNSVARELKKHGYTTLHEVDNGKAAYTHILNLKEKAKKSDKSIEDLLDIVLTDIEMPQMDGLTLCRRIKKELGLKLPVIVFSSLISDQMKHKCNEVGADAALSKPQVGEIIELMDQFILNVDSGKPLPGQTNT